MRRKSGRARKYSAPLLRTARWLSRVPSWVSRALRMQSRNSRIRVLWIPKKRDSFPSITPYRVPSEMPASAAISRIWDWPDPFFAKTRSAASEAACR
jgi:hypothetical protein